MVVLTTEDGAEILSTEAAAVAWVHDAYAHLKVIGYNADAAALLEMAGVEEDAGVVLLAEGADALIDAAANGRVWEREAMVRSVY
jgi:catalase